MYANTKSYELTDNTFNFTNRKQLDKYTLFIKNNWKTNRNKQKKNPQVKLTTHLY